ncbi:MAG: SH3 domain-containing protein [Pedobacter sp.]|nr:MAG: SH3 domain-containing protein [Pedobacter sp.]
MSLLEKYKALTDAATAAGITDLAVREQEGILYVDGTAANGATKDHLWETYNLIDPNFASADLVLNVNVAANAAVTHAKVITQSSNLNIRKGPGTDQPVVGKAAHGEIITLVNRSNGLWWLVRTADGEEGYCYAQYLEPQP